MTLTTVHNSKFKSRRFGRGGVVGLAEHRASVQRNADGSIDFDFYRKQAAALRRRARRQHVTLMCVYAAFLVLCMGTAIFNAPATSVLSSKIGGVAAVNLSIKP